MLSYLIIGSNQGERENHFNKAKLEIEKVSGKIIKESSLYETDAWGFSSTSKFLNQVIALETLLKPQELLDSLLNIETLLGRTRESVAYSDRVIDIDILFYENEIVAEQHLKIPHYHIEERRFVLMPMTEIAGDFVHPITNKTMHQLLEICSDNSSVIKKI